MAKTEQAAARGSSANGDYDKVEKLADSELDRELTIAVYEPERRARRFEQLLHERLLRRARERFATFQIPR